MASDYEALLLAQVNFLLNNTPVLLQQTTVGSPQPSVVLNVPSGTAFNFLQVKWRARSDSATTAVGFNLRMNGDTGTNYLWEVVQGNNTTTASTTSGAGANSIQIGTICAASGTANYFSSGFAEIGGASDTTNFKTVTGNGVGLVTSSNMFAGVYSGQWNSAAAVTSVTVFNGGNLVAGSIFSLYGWS